MQYYYIDFLHKYFYKSQVRDQKVGEKVQWWKKGGFTPKNTKSPPKSRAFVLGGKIVAPIWDKCSVPFARSATSLMRSITSFAACRNFICAKRNLVHLCQRNEKWCSREVAKQLFALKWCWPSVKRCCAFGTNEKIQVSRLGFFGSPCWVSAVKRCRWHVFTSGVRQSASRARREHEPKLCDTRLGPERTGDSLRSKRSMGRRPSGRAK